jgi:hypothetical protein
MKLYKHNIEEVIKYNPLFAKHTWFSKNRDTFFTQFIGNHQEAIKQNTTPLIEKKQNLRLLVKTITPTFIMKFILKKTGTLIITLLIISILGVFRQKTDTSLQKYEEDFHENNQEQANSRWRRLRRLSAEGSGCGASEGKGLDGHRRRRAFPAG